MITKNKKSPEIKLIAKIEPAEVLVLFVRKKSTDIADGLRIAFGENKTIAGILKNHSFDAARGACQIHRLPQGMSFKALILVGAGKAKNVDDERILSIAATVISKCRQNKWLQCLFVIPANILKKHAHIQPVVQGIWYSEYSFNNYKSHEAPRRGVKIKLWIKKNNPVLQRELQEAVHTMHGVWLSKDLANQPPNTLTPKAFKTFIQEHFKDFENFEVLVKDRKALKNEKFNLLLAVADGSVQEPFLIEINYRPKTGMKHLALVGKGVTFDSGGLSLKPSASMPEMKYDMAGAATVVGLMDVVARTQPALKVSACIATVENMPGPRAYRPGDVFISHNGKSVEVLNTDAEGRMILADALAYAGKKHQPDYMLDFATLTGACYVALGDQYAGLFCDDNALSKCLRRAGMQSGDKLWPMPMDRAYHKSLKSNIADIKNIGGRWGGAITAARFLQFFVAGSIWAHIDMAGMSNDLTAPGYNSKNASGFGVRLLKTFIDKLTKYK